MGLINDLARIMEESQSEYESAVSGSFVESKIFGNSYDISENRQQNKSQLNDAAGTASREDKGKVGNILAFGDNSAFMKYLLDECDMKGKVKLIYIDPPFFSKANYEAALRYEATVAATDTSEDGKGKNSNKKVKQLAYTDIWKDGMGEYLKMIALRLMFIKDLLADDGTVWIHLDWHSVHYVKVIADEIFGEQNFVNEIIWQYKSGGSSKRHFARKHDNILVYGKTKNYYLKLPKEKSYNRGLKPYRFKGVEEFCDEVGWYTLVNMKDVWNIDMVGRTAKERTGYATQKPEALLMRIIEAASCEGDIVADFFCGSGTLGAVANKLGRSWLCCDNGEVAVTACVKRFGSDGAEFRLLTER